MKTLTLTIPTTSTKRYLNIAQAIRNAINNQQVVPNEKLPSARKLAMQLNVNRHTVMAAYNELVAQGWVETKERQGYTVAKSLPIHQSLPNTVDKNVSASVHQWRIANPMNDAIKKPASNYQTNFAGGTPDISLFPFDEFRSYVNDALKRPAISELNYGGNAGFSPFIFAVETYLRRVRGITNKEIVVVNGTQEALYILAHVLLHQGDKVAVENLGYKPAWKAFESSGAQLIGVNQTLVGIDIDHLKQLFQQHKIRLLYLTPLHQYPTTVTLSPAKRKQVYLLAQQYNVPIIEDDYDHEFHYDSQPLEPMAANDPAGLVIYLASFSKLMFPGIRLGVIALDKSIAHHIINYRATINHKANVLMQDAVSRWMLDGAFERQLRKLTRIYHKRRQLMIHTLKNFKKQGIEIDFIVPPGGMALWVNIGKNAEQVAQKAREHGIFILSEQAFHLDVKNNQNKYLRLGFSGQDEDKMVQGLHQLKRLLESDNYT